MPNLPVLIHPKVVMYFVNQWIITNLTFSIWCSFPCAEIDCIMLCYRFCRSALYQEPADFNIAMCI